MGKNLFKKKNDMTLFKMKKKQQIKITHKSYVSRNIPIQINIDPLNLALGMSMNYSIYTKLSSYCSIIQRCHGDSNIMLKFKQVLYIPNSPKKEMIHMGNLYLENPNSNNKYCFLF